MLFEFFDHEGLGRYYYEAESLEKARKKLLKDCDFSEKDFESNFSYAPYEIEDKDLQELRQVATEGMVRWSPLRHRNLAFRNLIYPKFSDGNVFVFVASLGESVLEAMEAKKPDLQAEDPPLTAKEIQALIGIRDKTPFRADESISEFFKVVRSLVSRGYVTQDKYHHSYLTLKGRAALDCLEGH